MQTITITGYLSRDAETATTRSGDNVARWNVPVRQGYGDNERTNWFRVSIWGKRADYAGKARKGEFVTVTGELTISEYEGKPQYEIRANDFQAVRPAPREGNADNAGPAAHSNGGWGKSEERAPRYSDQLDDDIPF